MGLEKLPGYTEAVKALEANMSPRAQHLAELERYVDGTQYAGRPDWFSDEKPIWERAPCVVYPIVRSAIDSNVDLLLGEMRYPAATVDGIDGDDADNFERAIARVVQQSRLRAAAREVFGNAQGCGSACAIFGIRAGRLFIDTTRARWCEVEIDAEGAVRKLTIQYPYLTTEKLEGSHVIKAKLYRRVIDAEQDITYLPADAREDGTQPTWLVDAAQTVRHGLGFCPVVWYAHMKGCSVVGDHDGRAIHEHLTDEIRAHDFALSQRHRAALYAGDPQWTEIGVQPGYNPTSAVARVEVPASISGKPGDPVTGGYVSRPLRRGRARKKSPGTVWQYDGKPSDVAVELHTLPGDALEALDKHARDLRVKLAESLGVVFLDPETIHASTTLSGRALEALKARQLDRCDNYRSDFGDRFLLPSLGMLIRIARTRKLVIEGFEIVERVIKMTGESWSWQAPPFGLTWGRYFRLEPEEEMRHVELAAKAKDASLATKRAAVEKIAPIFGIKDIDAYLDELDDEQEEAMRRQQEMAADMMQMTGENDGQDDNESGAAARAPCGRRPVPPRATNGKSAAQG